MWSLPGVGENLGKATEVACRSNPEYYCSPAPNAAIQTSRNSKNVGLASSEVDSLYLLSMFLCEMIMFSMSLETRRL